MHKYSFVQSEMNIFWVDTARNLKWLKTGFPTQKIGTAEPIALVQTLISTCCVVCLQWLFTQHDTFNA